MPKSKPRPDFLGLMDVMKNRAVKVQTCRHESVSHISYKHGRKGFVMELVCCESCGLQFWRNGKRLTLNEISIGEEIIEHEPEIASQARNDKLQEIA